MAAKFNGVINLDVRDSVADWDAFVPLKAPAGAPTMLVVVFDVADAHVDIDAHLAAALARD